MAVPYFVIDAPGGGGKVRLLPNSVVEQNKDEVVITNYEGKVFRYRQPEKKNGTSSENGKSRHQDCTDSPLEQIPTLPV
jgi:hypothetical protein